MLNFALSTVSNLDYPHVVGDNIIFILGKCRCCQFSKKVDELKKNVGPTLKQKLIRLCVVSYLRSLRHTTFSQTIRSGTKCHLSSFTYVPDDKEKKIRYEVDEQIGLNTKSNTNGILLSTSPLSRTLS